MNNKKNESKKEEPLSSPDNGLHGNDDTSIESKGNSIYDLVKEKASADDVVLTEFEKKVLAQEKEIREGKNSSNNIFPNVRTHRSSSEVSPTEINAVNKRSPYAITAALVVFFALVGSLAFIISDADPVLAGVIIGFSLLTLAFIPFSRWAIRQILDEEDQGINNTEKKKS